MTTTFTTTFNPEKNQIDLTLESGVDITIKPANNKRFSLKDGQVFMLTKKNQIQMIGSDKSQIPKLEFDGLVMIDAADLDLELDQLVQYLIDEARASGLKLAGEHTDIKLPSNVYKNIARELKAPLTALSAFGIKLEKKKFVSPKAQHRWKKVISAIEFFIDREDGVKATVIWQKSNQMVIKAGATMLKTGGMRADGTPGLAYTFTKALRDEHQDKWDAKTFTTTQDIVLKSVNEVGHFLYFAGTNSWLEMYDKDGRSIHELTVV